MVMEKKLIGAVYVVFEPHMSHSQDEPALDTTVKWQRGELKIRKESIAPMFCINPTQSYAVHPYDVIEVLIVTGCDS
ncbi:hypothetical protein VNO78_23787 [Psophocarpus tetragonolobus]|uniref:Uncharacterized protein n=1 Tax=Psophocarpus tetragonolobus TaxID=3891 RepID=A0AAN9S4S9_PSOTE